MSVIKLDFGSKWKEQDSKDGCSRPLVAMRFDIDLLLFLWHLVYVVNPVLSAYDSQNTLFGNNLAQWLCLDLYLYIYRTNLLRDLLACFMHVVEK